MNPQLALSLPAQPVLCINKHTVDSSTSLRSGFSRILNLVLENITLYYTCVLTMFWWDTVQSHEQGARDLNVGNVKATLSSNLLVTTWSFSSLDWTGWQRPDAGLDGWRIPRHRALFPFDSSRVPSAASERGIPARACCADPLARRTTNESKIEANSPPCSAVERADPRAFPPSLLFFFDILTPVAHGILPNAQLCAFCSNIKNISLETQARRIAAHSLPATRCSHIS